MSVAAARGGRPISEVAVGETVPPVRLELTMQRLVMIAAANRDFAPTHVDAEAARATGAEHAYGNMMVVMALLERTVEQWAGPGARLRSLTDVRMSGFNRAGDTVTCRGEVAAVDDEKNLVRLDLWLETSPDRRTATASADVELPV
jgi:acyl dehydratase